MRLLQINEINSERSAIAIGEWFCCTLFSLFLHIHVHILVALACAHTSTHFFARSLFLSPLSVSLVQFN